MLQQRIGVRIGRVEKGPLKMSVRRWELCSRTKPEWPASISRPKAGSISCSSISSARRSVKGDPLLSIYSPKFFSTQQELLTALRCGQNLGGGQRSLAEAARRRLELWDVPPDEIDQLVRTGQPQKDLVLRSPITGTVLERNVF